MPNDRTEVPSSSWTIAPWLSVRGSAQAVAFYQAAFDATEVFRLEDAEGGVVARLSVHGAEFWVSDESPEHGNFSPQTLGGGTMRMILTVEDPDAVVGDAIAAGATQVCAVSKSMAGGWGAWPTPSVTIGKSAGSLTDKACQSFTVWEPRSISVLLTAPEETREAMLRV